jgi:zinc protease
LDRILQLKDEPSFIASSVFDKRVFGDTYYASPEIGYENSVMEISNNDIKLFYRDNITAANTKFIVVGNLTETEAVDQFNKYLGGWNTTLNSSLAFEMPKRDSTNFYFVHKENSAQSEIRVGHIAKKRNAEDHIQTKIMNTILGGQFSSRINLNLREDKGFTYGAGSSYQYYQDAGSFEVSTAVDIENTGAAIFEIIKELKGIRENISPEEIELAKSYLIKQFPSRFETYSQVAKNIEQLVIHNLPINELKNYTEKIENAAREEICSSALENVFPDELVVVAVGNRSKISSQLQNLTGKEAVELDFNGDLLD